jgi:hypothetical protein
VITAASQENSPFLAYLQVDLSDSNVTVGYNNDHGLDVDSKKPKASVHPKVGSFDGYKGKYRLNIKSGRVADAEWCSATTNVTA